MMMTPPVCVNCEPTISIMNGALVFELEPIVASVSVPPDMFSRVSVAVFERSYLPATFTAPPLIVNKPPQETRLSSDAEPIFIVPDVTVRSPNKFISPVVLTVTVLLLSHNLVCNGISEVTLNGVSVTDPVGDNLKVPLTNVRKPFAATNHEV